MYALDIIKSAKYRQVVMDIKEYSAIAKQLVAEHFGAAVQGAKYLGGGSFGRVFKVSLDKAPFCVVLKIYLVEGMNLDEAADLKLLREANAVHVPDVYFVSQKSEGAAADAVCMEFIEGYDCFTHFSFLFYSRKRKRAFADKVSDVIINLHAKTSDKFGFARNPEFDSWQAFYRTFVGDIITRVRDLYKQGRFEKRIYDLAEFAYLSFDRVFDEPVKKGVLSHGDSNVMNMMANSRLELVAFIDPWNALYCDPDYDLYQLGTLTGNMFGLRKAYKQKAAVSPKCDLKMAYYGFMTELNCYARTGAYTPIIMNSAIRSLKKELRKFGMR